MASASAASTQMVRQIQAEQKQALQYIEKTKKALDQVYSLKRVLQLDNTPLIKKLKEVTKELDTVQKNTEAVLSLQDKFTIWLKELKTKLDNIKQQKIKLTVETVDKSDRPQEKMHTSKESIRPNVTKNTSATMPNGVPAAFGNAKNVAQSNSGNRKNQVTEYNKNTFSPKETKWNYDRSNKGQVFGKNIVAAVADKNKDREKLKRSKSGAVQKWITPQFFKPAAPVKNSMPLKSAVRQSANTDRISGMSPTVRVGKNKDCEKLKQARSKPTVAGKRMTAQFVECKEKPTAKSQKKCADGSMNKEKNSGANLTSAIAGKGKECEEFKRKNKSKESKKRRVVSFETTNMPTGLYNPDKNVKPKTVTMTMAVKDKITGVVNPIKNKLDVLNKKTIQPLISIKDQATQKIKALKESFTKLYDNPYVKTATKLVQAGIKQENQRYTIAQTVAATNRGRSKEEITSMQNSYFEDLKKNAYKTSFTIDEVAGAGSMALEASGGNTGMAMELIKVAENMTAMTPGKSLAEAVEALADMKAGNADKMEEFGFKASPEDVQKAGGMDAMINMKIKPFFAGGAEQLMNTGGGLISTIKEKVTSKFDNLGFSMLEKLKPHLKSVSGLIDKLSPTIDKLSGALADGFGFAITQISNVALPVINTLADGLGWIVDILTKYKVLGGFVKSVATAFLVFQAALIAVKTTILLVKAVTGAWKIAQSALDIVMKMSPIGWMILGIGALIAVGVLLIKHWDTVKTVVSKVWNSISGLIGGAINGIIGTLQSIGQAIKLYFVDKFQDAWGIIQSIIDKIKGAVDWVKDKFDGFTNGVANVFNGAKNGVVSAFNWITGKHATGLTRVPRDNYPALLHEGERVLTKQEAMLYDHRFDVVQTNIALNRLQSRDAQSNSPQITIAKIAESIVIREEADIQKIANALAASLETVAFNYAGR